MSDRSFSRRAIIVWFSKQIAAAGIIAVTAALASHAREQHDVPQLLTVTVDRDGTVHIPAYALPLSIFMSDEARQAALFLRRSESLFGTVAWPLDR